MNAYPFFDFDKSAFLYQFFSFGGFGIDGLWLSFLGVLIFLGTQLLFFMQNKKPKIDFNFLQGMFFSKIESAILVLIFFVGGFGIGYLCDGIFSISLMVVFSLLVLLAAIDCKILAVPDFLNMLLFVCALAFAGRYSQDFWGILLGGLALAGLFSVLRIFGDMIFHREILGEGDVIFGGSVGVLLGVYDSLMSVFWGCVFACVYAFIARIFGKKITKLPLVTFICIGLLFCFLVSVFND